MITKYRRACKIKHTFFLTAILEGCGVQYKDDIKVHMQLTGVIPGMVGKEKLRNGS